MYKIHIVHLYPQEMNIYGDNGNILALKWRLLQRDIDVQVSQVGIGDKLPSSVDVVFAGGGQDSGQDKIKQDLQSKGKELKAMANDGVVMLMICGMYQLFGHYFETKSGLKIFGISLFDAFTKAGDKRLIGNIVLDSEYGRLVGFENHSGQTYLADEQLALGRVTKGHGNQYRSGFEGAVINNAFGTYLHGPLLPKNPGLADELIKRAVQKRYGIIQLRHLDDTIALKAADIAAKRP